MTTGVALSDHDAVIRDLMDEDKMMELTGDEGPIISRIRKVTEWSGDTWDLPVQYGTNQSVSADFATMQALGAFNRYTKFTIDPYEYFGHVLFSRRFLKSAKGPNAEKYLDGMEAEWAGLMRTLVLERSFQFYGDGSGCRGRLTSAAHPTRPSDVAQLYVYLEDPADSVYFEVGMEINLAAAKTGGSVRSGNITITGIDPETGKLTSDQVWSTITGAAAQDYVYRDGDYDAVMPGLSAWIPPTAPSATAFEGVVRTAHVAKLAGNRIAVGTMSLAEAWRHAAKLTRTYGTKSVRQKDGGMSLIGACNPEKWNELETELHASGKSDFIHDVGEFGYSAIRMRTPAGVVDIYGDPMCPNSYSWLLDTQTWKLRSAGKMPEIFTDDGLRILREAAANQYEGRAGWIAALGCRGPGNNAIIDHSR